jgi:hypothetical protein
MLCCCDSQAAVTIHEKERSSADEGVSAEGREGQEQAEEGTVKDREPPFACANVTPQEVRRK